MSESARPQDTMRRPILFSTALVAATLGAGLAVAGDRYGPPEPVKPANVSAVDWNGPLLGWTNKGSPEATDTRPAASASPKTSSSNSQSTVVPLSASRAAPRQPAALPTSIYAPAAPAPAQVATAATAPGGYQPARPTGEVLTLSLADLPPAGPSLERQQAADEEASVLAAQVARANALAAKDIAAGKPVTGGNSTDLLGGP
jgi:hypothetical protein